MITLSKSGNTVTFTFDENSGYLQNGTIDVPVNSLSLILDESNMATFRKSASNDIFVSANLAEFGMSKSDLIDFYKTSMVGSSGGGGGDITSGEVQTMIDESISGKADSVSAVSSAEYVSSSTTINFKNVEGAVISSIDASDFVIDGMVDDVRIETISGASYLVIDFNTASGKEDIQIPLTDIFDPSNYYTKAEVDAAVSGLAESSAVTLEISEAVSGKADSSSLATVATSGSYNDLLDKPTIDTSLDSGSTNAVANSAITLSLNSKADKTNVFADYQFGATNNNSYIRFKNVNGGDIKNEIYYASINDKNILTKSSTWASNNLHFSLVETSAVTSSVTSGSTDSEIPTAKAVFDAIGQGGGGTVSTAITSGDTNAVAGGAVFDAVNFVYTYDGWEHVEFGGTIDATIIKLFVNSEAIEVGESATVNVTFIGNEGTYQISCTKIDEEGDVYTEWDLTEISDFIESSEYDWCCELTLTANTPFGTVTNADNYSILTDINKYYTDTQAVSVKDKVDNSVNGITIGVQNDTIGFYINHNNYNSSFSQIPLADDLKGEYGKLTTNITVPTGGDWAAVTIIDDSTKETEEINANQVKITLTGTPSDGNVIYVNDVDDNWGTITYDSGSWTDDTQLGLTIVLDGNVLYLTASNDQLIKAIAADDNPELIDSVQKYVITTQDLIPYVQATKSDLGGLKLQQVTQAQYDALVSGGTIDNSTLYVIVN